MLEARPKPLLSRTEAKADELPSTYEFIPRLGRTYVAPKHLDPLVRSLEAAWTRPVYQTAHAPPRHAKTDTVLAWAALTLRRQPWRTIAYISYEAQVARSKSRKARAWYLATGGKLAEGASNLSEWLTPEGGGFLSGGIGGPLTSRGVDVLIVDDPYKHRQQAESTAYRQMVTDWWGDVGETRIEPGGSAFIFHTRWTTDDLIGHVLNGEGGIDWEPHIRLPAIDDKGQALWSARWPLEALDRKRRGAGPLTWASLYQGQPRPRGGSVFNGTHLFDSLNAWERIVIGVDLAYSSRKSADYSIAVVLAEWNARYYVLEVLRRQEPAPVFRKELRALGARWGNPRMHAYLGGTEKGIADFINDYSAGEDGVRLEVSPATADKLVRAQPTAASWNEGHIFVPSHGESIGDFTGVLLGFTGAGGSERDDDVDALVAAYDVLAVGEAEYDPSYDQYLPSLRA